MRRTLAALLLGAAGISFSPAPAAAQTDPQLAAAVRLAQEGQGDSARALARRILAATPTTDAKYPEALFTVALVAATAQDRRLNLQRIIVEYAQSEWADDALLQLAQLEYASRNAAGTIPQIQRLLADYPQSPLRAVAALWGARAAFDQRDRALACQWSDLGLAAAGEDVEIRNQLEFQRDRCRALMAADTTRPAPQPPPAAPAVGWTVQVAAFRSRADTDATMARLRRLNISAAVVHEGAWFKVRAGPFADQAAARQALARIRQTLGGQPFLVPPPRR